MNQISEGMSILCFGPDGTVSLRNLDEALFQR